jgi:hypothetical protein
MALISVKYGRASDNVAPNATSITATTEDSEYPAENAIDLDPGKPAKLTGTTGSFVFDFGAAQRMDHVAIIHHNLTAGLGSVKFQCNSSNSWGSPTVDATLTVPSDWEDNYPVSFHKDLTGVSGYSSGGFRYARLNFGSANDAAIALGEIVILSQARTLSIVRPDVTTSEQRPLIEHGTDYEIATIYDRGTPVRTFSAEVLNNGTTSTIDSWYRDVKGRVLPFLFIPNAAVNDAWFVRFAEPVKQLAYLPGDGTLTSFRVKVTEVGKGLYL